MRNPTDFAAEFKIDPPKVFELPKGAAKSYIIVNPFKDQALELTKLVDGEDGAFQLRPF